MEKDELRNRLTKHLHRLKIDLEATELAIWVYELLENPTEFNTSEEIFLAEAPVVNKIQIGLLDGYVTEKPFDSTIMRHVAEIFNKESDYTGEFYSSTFSYGYPFIKITKKKAAS